MSDETLTPVTPTKMFNQYLSSVPSIQIITGNGKAIVFVNGKYHTDKVDEIAFLDGVVAEDRGTIYVNRDKPTVSAEDLDPMKALEAQFRAKFIAEMQAQLDPNNDRGTSEQGKLNAASTTTIAPVAAGGDGASAGLMAKLMASK